MRYCTWDIETSDLKGDVGRILCAVIYEPIRKKYTIFRNDELSDCMADDAAIAVALRDELEKYHITMGWFSKGFDMSFVNTRLVKGGHKTIRPHLHLDGIWYMKGWRGLNTRSAKLAVAAEFFELKNRKPGVDVDVWISAAFGGNTEAMDILVDRCKADCKITSDVTDKLLDTGVVKNIQTYP